ncbi:hypothetical protein UCDDA912_g02098 [Diaporthe ampelina]|uniref:Uncharacterized protein n=1 Tax=Diaporthe ampelina TaxID=1214573 RepID=A0A0G2FV86_9PEZI|nr:hypothetical protein UCDDA912_g02098 [Diaporthe ampelina]
MPLFLSIKLTILPAGIAHETLKTFALLFPQPDYVPSRRGKQYKQQWLSNLRQDYEQDCGGVLDRRLTKCGTLDAKSRQIEQFKFWRDRLVILKQAYDDATPRTLSQWWHDRRNGVQWYTFWVAILVLVLTVVFGVIQCIEGGLQVYKAYHV